LAYLRSDKIGGGLYVGQTKSDIRYLARQTEHARANPNADYEFFELGRAEPGQALDRLEEDMMRRLGGLRSEGGSWKTCDIK
jgi:hypothetical protein